MFKNSFVNIQKLQNVYFNKCFISVLFTPKVFVQFGTQISAFATIFRLFADKTTKCYTGSTRKALNVYGLNEKAKRKGY